MNVKRLAFYTIAILHEPPGHPVAQGFIDRIPDTFAAAERSAGFIDRAKSIGDWGPIVLPSFVPNDMLSRLAQTYSLWRDLESVYAYAYTGRHSDGLKRRRDWFREEARPGYVGWWVAEDHRPDTSEAIARLEQLHVRGPSPEAFNFTHPFDQRGQPVRLDRDAVRAMIEQNRAIAVSPPD